MDQTDQNGNLRQHLETFITEIVPSEFCITFITYYIENFIYSFMKHLSTFKLFESIDHDEIHRICKKYSISNYTINLDKGCSFFLNCMRSICE